MGLAKTPLNFASVFGGLRAGFWFDSIGGLDRTCVGLVFVMSSSLNIYEGLQAGGSASWRKWQKD